MLTTAYRLLHGEKLLKHSPGLEATEAEGLAWGRSLTRYAKRRWSVLGRDDIVRMLADPDCRYHRPIRKTHVSHPMSVWVRESRRHFQWVARYSLALCREHLRRPRADGTVSTSAHVYQPYIEWFNERPPATELFAKRGFHPIPLCMEEGCRSSDNDPVKSYRAWVMRKHRTFVGASAPHDEAPQPHRTALVADWKRDPDRRPLWSISTPTKEELFLECT